MTSAAVLAANRANAARSTGPRTRAGKQRSARNALRHGLNQPVLADPELAAEAADLAGRIAGLAPVTRTSMAYPMSTKFRTGMAVAMFAIVTFVVVYMSIFKDVLIQNFGQVDAQSGHWQIVAGSPDFNFNSTDRTAFRTDVATLVQTDSTTAAEVRGVGWENLSGTIIRGVKPPWWPIHVRISGG